MLVVGSTATPKMERVYHRLNCAYAKRIKWDNRREMSTNEAENRHYCACKYCAGLKGDVKTSTKQIKVWENKNNMKFTYQEKCNTLYIQTGIGFWKIYQTEENGKYSLYHRNKFDKTMSFAEASHGDYHRQCDVKATESLQKITEYIAAHDRAKAIIMDDYHKLPKHSKKQKKYYRQAERRANKQSARNVDLLFAMLEQKNPRLQEAVFG